MRRFASSVLALVGCLAGACAGIAIEAPAEGNETGGSSTGGAEAGNPSADSPISMEGGAAGVAGRADAGASGESFAGAGGIVDATGGDAGAPTKATSIWTCDDPLGERPTNAESGGAGGEAAVEQYGPPSLLPAGGEATLTQLIGRWAHSSAADWYGYIDYFQFNVDGTGSQNSSLWTDTATASSTTFAGTFELANHVITLDSTAGTNSYQSTSTSMPLHIDSSKYEKLPHQIIHYGYSYDSTTDTLYASTATCSTPLPFKRE